MDGRCTRQAWSRCWGSTALIEFVSIDSQITSCKPASEEGHSHPHRIPLASSAGRFQSIFDAEIWQSSKAAASRSEATRRGGGSITWIQMMPYAVKNITARWSSRPELDLTLSSGGSAGQIRSSKDRHGHSRRRPGRQQGESWLTAAVPMDSPYCSCKLTLARHWSHGLQLQFLWIVPTAAVSYHVLGRGKAGIWRDWGPAVKRRRRRRRPNCREMNFASVG